MGPITPNSLPTSSSMAPYVNSIQAYQDSSAPAAPTSQAAALDHQRHYYSSSSSLPGQYDSDERPTKSPRHSYMGNSSTYQNFETPFAAALPSAARAMYYSPAAQSQPWVPPPNASTNYAQALQPQPQHHPSQSNHAALPPPRPNHQQAAHIQQQQHHQPPPQQPVPSYSYSSEAYPSSTREDAQNLNSYNWSPAAQ